LRAKSMDSRCRLLAASALAELGRVPDDDEWLGVVAEMPLELGLDSLALYADGNIRYVNQSGAVLLYGPADGRLASLATAASEAARLACADATVSARRARPPVVPGEISFTFLTPRGPRIARARTDGAAGAPIDLLFARLSLLLAALVELTRH
jgi:hypothetical protein